MNKSVLTELNKIEAVRAKVIESMENYTNQRYLYTMPYETLNLTNPANSNEIGISINDVYVAVKQIQDYTGEIYRQFELYKVYENEGKTDIKKIAETDLEGKIVPDKDAREITDEIVKLQNHIKKLAEHGQNLKVAGLDKDGRLDAYIQIMNREIAIMSAAQKEHKDDKLMLKNKKKEEVQKASDDKEEQRNNIALGMGIDPQDIYQITEIQDRLFYENNNIPGTSGAFAIRKRDGELLIVTPTSDGMGYEKCNAFGESTNEMGRTAVMTNDDNKITESNTYGAVYSEKDDDLRYCYIYGQYGEIEIVEQRRVFGNRSGQTMGDNDIWSPSRKITTDNLALEDIDNKGIGPDNETRNMMNKHTMENYDVNDEAARYRNERDPESLNPQDIADGEARAEFAYNKILEELKIRGIEPTSEQKEKIMQDIEGSEQSFGDEDVKNYCDNFEEQKQAEENERNTTEEKTLAGDALKRRFGI